MCATDITCWHEAPLADRLRVLVSLSKTRHIRLAYANHLVFDYWRMTHTADSDMR
jgi:hypothetical protein